MVQAYSQLKQVLSERRMTVPELHRRMMQHGMRVNLTSLYRLSHDHQPLERLDLRMAGAICQVCEVPLSELIRFEALNQELRRLSVAKQRCLDTLMAKHNEGRLTDIEREEFKVLVRETEAIALANARLLARQR